MAYKEKDISITEISSEKNDLHDNDMDDMITDDNVVLEETDIPGAMLWKCYVVVYFNMVTLTINTCRTATTCPVHNFIFS